MKKLRTCRNVMSAVVGGLVIGILVMAVLGNIAETRVGSAEELQARAFLPLVMRSARAWKGVVQAAGGESLVNLYESWHYNYQPWEGWDHRGWVPMVRPGHCDEQDELEDLAELAEQNPGRTWLIFNEPDLGSQDATSYQAGAVVYESLYDAIKGADPTARLFCCGTAFGNTAWLEGFRQHLSRPVDGIHFHGYPCPSQTSQECEGPPYLAFNSRFDVQLAFSKMDSFHAYCQAHDEFAGLPIWLTEFGILSTTQWDTREQVLAGVMEPFFAYLDTGGLDKFEKVAWFSDRYGPTNASDLTFGDDSLTVLGEAWNGFRATAD